MADLLSAHGTAVELVPVETSGDRQQSVPIHEIGGQGVFVKEVDAAVSEGRADAAVHSAKDLPSDLGAGTVLAAAPARGDARDALVGCRLAALPPGARVATGAVRRRAQLAFIRPDLVFAELRGNVGTRLERRPPNGAVVVAKAALDRLGFSHRADEVLSPTVLLPQVGQGTIAVTARAGDEATLALLAAIDDAATRRLLEAERSFLAALGGGCDLPVGAYGELNESGGIHLEGMVASLDGHVVVRSVIEGDEAAPLGLELAMAVLAAGGAGLLAELGA